MKVMVPGKIVLKLLHSFFYLVLSSSSSEPAPKSSSCCRKMKLIFRNYLSAYQGVVVGVIGTVSLFGSCPSPNRAKPNPPRIAPTTRSKSAILKYHIIYTMQTELRLRWTRREAAVTPSAGMFVREAGSKSIENDET